MVQQHFARSFGVDGVCVVEERGVKEAGNIDDKPCAQDDAEHGRI